MQLKARQIIVALTPVAPWHLEDLTESLSTQYGIAKVKGFPLDSIGVHCIVFDVPVGRSVDAVIEDVSTSSSVKLVQRNQAFEGLATIHADPYASLQYGAKAVRADVAHGWSVGKGVRVALVDTGVDKEHPELRGHIIAAENFVQGGNQSFSQDLHGTAVAGVIAAGADDDTGIFGVAPEAELLALKACWHPDAETDKAVCSSWTIARAIDFAINADAHVLNLSLAGPPDPLIAQLLDAAHERRITVVAATADPAAPTPGFPASLESVIGVIASDVHGQIEMPQWEMDNNLVAAPGAEILTTAPGGSYRFLSGSSLSTAHVAGVVALLLEANPDLEPTEVSDILRASAQPVALQTKSSAPAVGLLDACRSLQRLKRAAVCR